MPYGIKFTSFVNVVLAVIFLVNLLFLEKVELAYPFANYINLVSAGALLLVTLIVLLRLGKLLGFARVLIYVVTLVLGLQILLTAKHLFTLYGMLTVIIDAIVIFYLIGVRGYLMSKHVAEYFSARS